jgi:hypothetical protein
MFFPLFGYGLFGLGSEKYKKTKAAFAINQKNVYLCLQIEHAMHNLQDKVLRRLEYDVYKRLKWYPAALILGPMKKSARYSIQKNFFRTIVKNI